MIKLLPLIFILLFSNNILAGDKSVKNSLPKEKKGGLIKAGLVDFSEIVPKLLPTIVNISTTKKNINKSSQDVEEILKILPEGSMSENLKDLLDKRGYSEQEYYSSGSGFIISEDGYIVTNNHVIDGTDEIFISLQEGEKIEAKLIGSDEKTDIALLKINVKQKLEFAKFGESSKSKIGEWVIAVGNPFGLGGSVSAGIISAHGRDISAGQINDFIQTDAAINKGNSGGPLFNVSGEVIGIATAIYSPSGGNIGIGFATPSDIAKDVVRELKKNGSIKRGYLGVSVQKITQEIAESINLKEVSGAMVVKVFEGSPADKGGVLPGDIIFKFNDKKIVKMKELPMIVGKTKIGTKVEVGIIRLGKKKNVTVRIEKLEEEGKKEKIAEIDFNIFGMSLKEVDDKDTDGLLVENLKDNSIAESKGILKGDILLSINQVKLKSVKSLNKIVAKSQKNQKEGVFLIIKRGESNFTLVLPIK